MYVGFALFFLPFLNSNEIEALSEDPQLFGFEDELSRVSSTEGSPEVIVSSLVDGDKIVKVENGDYVRWNLPTPSRTLDLSFKVYWTRLPLLDNESMLVGEIFWIDDGFWQTIFTSKLYTDRHSYNGWNLWTDLSGGQVSSVSGGFLNLIESNRWYTIRITVDLDAGCFELYLDAVKLASIEDVKVLDSVFIDFFRIGAGVISKSVFVTYYDDLIASALPPVPQSSQWSLSITSSFGGFTNPSGVVNLDPGEDVIVKASESSGFVFNKWIFNGVDYGTNPILKVPAKSIGSRHILHALFVNINSEPIIEYEIVLIEAIGLTLIGIAGYILVSNRGR